MSENNPLRLEIVAFFIMAVIFVLWSFKQCHTETPRNTIKKPKREKKREKPSENNEKSATLYVTVDSLKLRTAPNLDSTIIMRLPRKQTVEFYGLRTSFRQKININNSLKNEPWVYIRTASGREGWVYAGGLTFYNIK